MSKNNKNCSICVYNDVCKDRKGDLAIRDCCVPEAPLRKLQAHAKTAEQFAEVTNDYISRVKCNSVYWNSVMDKRQKERDNGCN